MGKIAKPLDNKLPEFQKYLLDKKLVPAKNVPFYAHWVTRFLGYVRKNELPTLEYQEAAVLGFLDSLKSDTHVLDWQYRQANDSLRLYYFHYLNKTNARSVKALTSDKIPDIIQETKRLIRLKHYAYSTERTYIQWIERFLAYVGQTAKKAISETDSSDFKNFLSHLAIKQRVSASTQNQAFNAILFFFRYVLGKEVRIVRTGKKNKKVLILRDLLSQIVYIEDRVLLRSPHREGLIEKAAWLITKRR